MFWHIVISFPFLIWTPWNHEWGNQSLFCLMIFCRYICFNFTLPPHFQMSGYATGQGRYHACWLKNWTIPLIKRYTGRIALLPYNTLTTKLDAFKSSWEIGFKVSEIAPNLACGTMWKIALIQRTMPLEYFVV